MHRRSFLRGLGGIAVALPTLEIMLNNHGDAYADGTGIPKRFLVVFGGHSLGADGDPLHNLYVPDKVGPDYDLKTALAPLAAVKSDVSVVSGLKIPWAAENGGTIPAGGRSDDFHIQSLNPLFTGMRSVAEKNRKLNGPTADHVVAAVNATDTKFKTLNYQVQAGWYLAVSAPYGRDIMSCKLDSTGKLVEVPATISPRAAFDGLFTGFTGTDPLAVEKAAFELKKRKTILDLVRGNSERLMPKLGKVDQARLQRHLDEIRDLERRIASIPPTVTDVCKKLPDPGADPPLGGNNESTGGASGFDVSKGYSNEEARAKLMCDLVAMAFACDMARSGTLMLTMAQSHMNMHPLIAVPYDMHEVGHAMKTPDMSRGIAWHVKQFAYLVQKLGATPDGAGKLLDSSALVYLNEGGHGYDPEGKKDNSAHSTDRMAALIAGRAGGLKPGKHIVAAGKHPVNVVNSAMKAVGVDKNLGEVVGVIPDLFT